VPKKLVGNNQLHTKRVVRTVRRYVKLIDTGEIAGSTGESAASTAAREPDRNMLLRLETASLRYELQFGLLGDRIPSEHRCR